MFYIYILYSETSDIYYVGYSIDVDRRVKEHNSLENKSFTGKHQPWILKCSFVTGNNRNTAMIIEKFIMRQKSKVFIKKVIDNPMSIDFIAQLVRVPSPRD